MYLLKYIIKDVPYFLHDGETFVGTEDRKEADVIGRNLLVLAVSVGGFDIVEVKDSAELTRKIGGIPYPIIEHRGGIGQRLWYGVRIVA